MQDIYENALFGRQGSRIRLDSYTEVINHSTSYLRQFRRRYYPGLWAYRKIFCCCSRVLLRTVKGCYQGMANKDHTSWCLEEGSLSVPQACGSTRGIFLLQTDVKSRLHPQGKCSVLCCNYTNLSIFVNTRVGLVVLCLVEVTSIALRYSNWIGNFYQDNNTGRNGIDQLRFSPLPSRDQSA